MAKQASLQISIAVDSGRVKSNLDQVRAAFVQATSGINTSLSSIKGFTDLKKQTEATSKAYAEVQQKVADLAREVKGGAGGAAMAKDFEKAKKEAGQLKQTLESQQQSLHTMRQSMAGAGVATSGLGAAQARLRAELEQTKGKFHDLAKVANAQDALGLRKHTEIRAEIQKTRESYKLLAQSGQYSAREQAQAWVQMQEQVKGMRGQMNGWGQSLSAAKGQLIASGVAAAVWGRGVAGAAGQAIKFESAFADVRKVVEGSPEQMAGLSREIIGLGRSIPVAHEGLAQIAAMGGQMGIPIDQIGAFTKAAATMGTAFSIPADQVGKAIGTLKSIFGLTIPEVVGLGDNINVLGNSMSTNEASIISVLARIGGSAKIFGLSKEGAAALSAAMLDLGQTPETAATSINALLSKLQTANVQTPKFKEALQSIGLSAEQMARMVAEKPQQAINTLLETLGKLNNQQQAEALTQLFGTEYQDNLAVLVQGIDRYRKALGLVDDQTKVLGSTQREADARNETSEAKLQLLKNTWAEVATNIGNLFLPALNLVVGVLRGVTEGIADFARQFPGLTTGLTLAAGAATAFFAVFAARNALMLLFGGSILQTIGVLKNLGPALYGTIPAINAVGAACTTLKGSLGALSLLMMAWEAGKWAGEWLNSFSPIQKGMVDLIYSADRVRLAAQKMWAMLTGGDVEGVNRQIEIAKQTHTELIKEIEQKATASPMKDPAQIEQEKQDEEKKKAVDPAKEEHDKNASVMQHNEEAVAKMRADDAAAEEARKKKEADDQAAAEEERRQKEADDRAAANKGEYKYAAQDRQLNEDAWSRNAENNAAPEPERQNVEDRQFEQEAIDDKEASESKAEKSQDKRRERASRANEQAANRERELRDRATAASEQAAARQADQVSQFQAEQAKAAEDRMAREQAATEKAKGIFQQYADRVKSLQDEISGREKSLKDDLAEMDPNADEETKWRRRAAEAKKYEQAAKEAQKAGNMDEAKSLADQARDAYKNLGSGAEGVDRQQAKQLAFAGVKSAGQLGLDIAKSMPTDLKKNAQFDLSKVEGLSQKVQAMLGAGLSSAAGPGGATDGAGKPTQVHEIRLGKASLKGSPSDVEEFLRQLELAGVSA